MSIGVHSVEDELCGDGTGVIMHQDPSRLIITAWSDEICRRG
jgi:hypothetical protein